VSSVLFKEADRLRRAGRVQVLLADGQALFRDALARALRRQAAFELVADVADAPALRTGLARHRPTVALLDVALLEAALAAVREPTRLLVLTPEVDAALAYTAVASGVEGYLSKDVEGVVICRAVAAVARGQSVLDGPVQEGLVQEIRLRVRDDRPVLSPREHEILTLIADGRTAPGIARQLNLSPATVKTHLGHLYEKLGVGDRAAAVASAMRRGLLE